MFTNDQNRSLGQENQMTLYKKKKSKPIGDLNIISASTTLMFSNEHNHSIVRIGQIDQICTM